MQLSTKPRALCCTFLESILDFEHFERKMSLIA